MSSPASVRCRHILVKHNESRRPSSWKEKNITRSKAEAMEIIKDFRERIVNKSETFEAIAERESDCSSHSRGGDLGSFTRKMMQKPFEDASFALKVGEMSGPVDTQSGIHIILRIE
eukprot:159459_1